MGANKKKQSEDSGSKQSGQQAVCFRCKMKFKARRDQHPKYSFCPACKACRDEWGGSDAWLDQAVNLPGGGSGFFD